MKYILLLILFIYSTRGFSQYNETIRTGRPGQAIGAFTVGNKVLQFQQGVDYSTILDSNASNHVLLNNNVIRYGFLETFEFSALIDYQNNYYQFDSAESSLQGLSNLHLGFRVHITDQKGWRPTTGFQMRLSIPNLSADYKAENIAPVMVFVANWALPKSMSFATNWILSYNGNDQYPTGKYVLNFAFPIHNKWSGFIENFGQVNQSVFQTRFDGGFAYLLNNDVQLDISAGYGDNQNVKDVFISTGISWRILYL